MTKNPLKPITIVFVILLIANILCFIFISVYSNNKLEKYDLKFIQLDNNNLSFYFNSKGNILIKSDKDLFEVKLNNNPLQSSLLKDFKILGDVLTPKQNCRYLKILYPIDSDINEERYIDNEKRVLCTSEVDDFNLVPLL